MRRFLLIGWLLFLTGASAYLLIKREMNRPMEAFDALPETPMLVLQAEQAPTVLADLRENAAFQSLESIGILSKLGAGLEIEKDLYSDPMLEELLLNSPTLAAAYMTRAGSFDYLFVRDLSDLAEKRPGKIAGLKWADQQTTTFEKKTICTISASEEGAEAVQYHYTINKGLLLASASKGLIEDAILHMKGGNPLTRENKFHKLSSAQLDEGVLRVFINYASLADYLRVFAAEDFAPRIDRLSNFGAWSALDLKVGEESIFINGLSTTDEGIGAQSIIKAGFGDLTDNTPASKKFLDHFSTIDTFGRQIEHVLPGNTALLFRLAGAELNNFLADQPRWIAPEWAFGMATSLDGLWEDRSFVCVRLTSPDEASKALGIEGEGKLTAIAPEQGTSITAGVFGPADAQSQLWGVVSGDYLLVTANKSFLQRIIAKRKGGNTLANEPGYQHYRQSLLDNANVFLYADMRNLEPVMKKVLATKYRDHFDSGFDVFRNIQPVAVQLDKHRDLFLTTGYLWKNSDQVVGDTELWRNSLDSNLAQPPTFVKNHATGAMEVLVQDKSNKVYLFSNGGDLIWSRVLDGPILGEINQVDYYKNRKLQYLLSTSSNIYLIDRKGRDVADFPIEMTSEASNGVFVVDYDGKRDYRMFIASSNGNLYGYYKTGKPLPGWSPKRKAGTISKPLKHFTHKGKDYLFAFNEAGTIYLWDRRGDKRIPPVELKTRILGEIQVDRSGATPYLVACDTIGNVYRIGLDGKHTHLQIPRVDAATTIEIADVAGDSKLEYLVLTGQQLDVYDVSGKRSFSYKLPDSDGNRLNLVDLPGSLKQTICLSSPRSGEWLALDAEGNTLPGFPVQAEGVFTAGKFHGGEPAIVGGDGSSLMLQNWPN